MSLFRRTTRLDSTPHKATLLQSPAGASERIIAEIASLAAQNRYADAYEAANRGLESAPTDTALLFAKGSTLLDWGRFGESRKAYEDAERNGLCSVGLYRHLGWACFHGGDIEAAERYLRKAVLVAPGDFDAQFCLGVVLQAHDADDAATEALANAVAIRPDDFQAQLMLGNCWTARGNPAAAEACYRNAASIDSSRAAAWVNLGSALRRQDKIDEAIVAFERAYEIEKANDDSDADAFFNLALGYTDVGRFEEARRILESGLARRPSAQAHYNYALLLLQLGHLQPGWRHHEFRWVLGEKPFERASYGKPFWSGQDVDGRTVLIRAEQGFGDTIQFIRYASLLKERGARVFLKVPLELMELAKGFPAIDAILPAWETPLDFDFYVHSLSLAAGFETTLDSIPASIPYIQSDPERKSRWQEKLGGSGDLSVGLVWAGSSKHKRDRYRSMRLKTLEPLFDIAGVRFVSLQKGPAVEEIEESSGRNKIINLGPELDDFADTAAVIDQLDLVIGVDTAVIHLAGAMGRPVWTLIPTPSDWRWLVDREDSPWYPTMRVFRQHANGDWQSVVERVKAQLARFVRDGTASADTDVSHPVSARTTKLAPTSPTSDNFSAVAETRYGIIQYLAEPAAIAKSLRLYGEYLQPQIDFLRRIVSANEAIIEMGAGVGAHAIALAPFCNSVIAYESNAIARRVLRQNLSINKVRNVTVMPANTGNPRNVVTGPSSPSLALDSLALNQLSLIKINDPVSPLDVVRGAVATLWRLRPRVLTAVADDSHATALHEQMVTFGYRCWRVQTPLFNADNFNRRRDNAFDGQCAFAVLAIPEELDVELPAAYHEIG